MADTILPFDFNPAGHGPPADPVREQEEALLISLRAGCESAFEYLIEHFQQPVYNLVYRLLDDPGETSDVVQEVFLKVFRSIGSFRGNSSLKTWIYRIAFNEACNHRRWFTRHKRREIGLDNQEDETHCVGATLPDQSRSAFDLVADLETHETIERALATLNPAFRAAVVLRDIEGLSYDEIAEVLQVSLGTVKSRILRGREGLRNALAGKLTPEAAMQWSPQLAR